MIVEEEIIPKGKSLNFTYRGTAKWKMTTEVIKLTTQNGGAEFTDELPGGMVKQRIIEHENAQKNKIRYDNSKTGGSFCSVSVASSASDLSVSSSYAAGKALFIQQQPKKSKIPVRSNSDVSSYSSLRKNKLSDLMGLTSKTPTPTLGRKNLNSATALLSSSGEDLVIEQNLERSRIPVRSNSDVSSYSSLRKNKLSDLTGLTSKTPTTTLDRKNSNLLFNKSLDRSVQKRSENIIKIYEINKDEKWALISSNHPFIRLIKQNCPEKITSALTYRERDKIRVINLSTFEIKMLEQMQQEDLKNNKIGIQILGKI